MSLRLPALRERRGDILPLARRAMQACARGAQPLSLSPEAERRLVEHDWPGNARELTNIVQRAAWLASGGRIDAADLDLQVVAPAAADPAPAATDAAPAAGAKVFEVALGRDLKERERELILATLRVTGGSRKLAAERLGISPRTLRYKLQQLKAAGVTVPRLLNEEFAAVSTL
jgi:two-component system response regulator FlrC